jgi:hypothetical protein
MGCGDLHKNNLCRERMHRITLRLNYFTSLTLLCGAHANGATPIYVAPVGTAPHIVSFVARSSQPANVTWMCGAAPMGATH